MKRSLFIFLLISGMSTAAYSQALGFSIATDFGLQRSFKKEQRYWAVGHTVHAQFHFAPQDAVYLWLSYYTEGKFTNQLEATAKTPLVMPPVVSYTNEAAMRFKHFSVGFKKYVIGRFDSENRWNAYAYAGFGLLLGRVVNSHLPLIDSNDYNLPVREGKANFKRLTLDLGAGVEYPIGADFYLYTEGRAWIPTTDYPSRHIFVNSNAPFVAMLNVGIRILF